MDFALPGAVFLLAPRNGVLDTYGNEHNEEYKEFYDRTDLFRRPGLGAHGESGYMYNWCVSCLARI